ncbi:MAG TPA: UvrD-helicase domain-containing protein [Terracidiphilus sp.]|jgi:ATP-dependent exoDNAse (exonuclease V) beta subunit|nr:UvrD-helicase domain-containing protein [Terracidiphilus sp.]
MTRPALRPSPPDQAERGRALDTARSVLVQAPAGSGKTDLLTRRFLSLLGEVDDPGQIVAITFTKAAAAEMRHRILSELEKASTSSLTSAVDELSVEALARRAVARSRALGWQLIDLPAQLRISTIDSFCRELAIQQPLLSGFASDLRIDEQPWESYARAARRALRNIDGNDPALLGAIQSLLLWRDNSWLELEEQLIRMLPKRDTWMHNFVLDRDPDWDALRERLEAPFLRAIRNALIRLDERLNEAPGARSEAHELACYACSQTGGALHKDLAELAEFPQGPFETRQSVEDALSSFRCLADLVLTKDGSYRRSFNKNNGFPQGSHAEKSRVLALIQMLRQVDGLEDALGSLGNLPTPRFTDEDWHIVRACFTLLRQAAVELRVVFAEAGAVDFTEVAQHAQLLLRAEDNLPSDAALYLADGIRHLLVDEFQDTSRRQHQLLASLVGAWPESTGRTLFVVGDPMQSIYFFRDADAELFPRVRAYGLELPDGESLLFDSVQLRANFRTQPALVNQLNDTFGPIFASDDGSGVTFDGATPAREGVIDLFPRLLLHTAFVPQIPMGDSPEIAAQKQTVRLKREAVRAKQTNEVVELIRGYLDSIERARADKQKFRVAVLGRTRKALEPIALALRKAGIPFRAVELEQLKNRPEVLDALALGRALLNPMDRIAWLSVLRAPWCGLALDELHSVTSADNPDLLGRPIPRLMAERLDQLAPASRTSVQRLLEAAASAPQMATASPTFTLGTWLEQVWLRVGGAACVDATAQANLNLLWRRLDALANGAQDFVGPALDRALERLTAIPDPDSESECGVQLMTIHKSKGLEFEVVIVPELQLRGFSTRGHLLSWLERGLPAPDQSGELTEFLIAPLQTKGADRSAARIWVDRLYRDRESQEMRRILYVAATRAREELHFFARPDYRDDPVEPRLTEAWNCLLETAWPAFDGEIRSRFQQWSSTRSTSRRPEPARIETLAASAEPAVVAPKPTLLRRLPADFLPPSFAAPRSRASSSDVVETGEGEPVRRHEGGIVSRALGTAVHKLLEETAHLRLTLDWPATRAALPQAVPTLQARIRAAGIARAEAHSIATRALKIALQSCDDPMGQWILSPHAEAASESAWAGMVADTLRSVRIDRIFRAGLEPLVEDNTAWWIIDYKTAHADNLDPSTALRSLRALFAPQLQAYAAILRRLPGGEKPLRAGLYYPRMGQFDWWEIKA